MTPMKKYGEGPDPGKDWSSIGGEYKDREEKEGGNRRMDGEKKVYGTYGEGGSGKGEIIWNVNKEYRK